MYFRDHNPPHFHVDTMDGKALYKIRTLERMDGHVDGRAEAEALIWAEINRFRLWRKWKEMNE